MTRPALYLVTVVHNRRAVSVAFADQLARQTWQQFRLVLVDDGSSDGTSEAVTAVLPTTKILRGDGNLWWGGGLQKALNWLKAQGLREDDLVAFMNDDVGLGADFLEKAVAEVGRLPSGNFLVVPGVLKQAGHFLDECVVCDWPRFRFLPYGDRPEAIDCATTRSLLMRWGDLDRVGGFRPTLLPHYLSDYEFTIRAHRKGIGLIPARSTFTQIDDETTGAHRAKGSSLSTKLALMVSPRFSSNPFHLSAFVWYAAPLPWKVLCWLQILLSTLKFLRS